MPLCDAFNRHINYLRISVTDRCNLRCRYCVPREGIKKLPHSEILRYEEILRIVKIAAKMGFKKVRLTGGEPLIRKNIVYLIENLTQIPGIEKVCLTTNGVLLPQMAPALYQAGLRHINISLDTLCPEKYAYITGVNVFKRVWQGIEQVVNIGFHPVKINVVMIKGFNDDELTELAKLSFRFPVAVRFIEFMPLTQTRLDYHHSFLSADEAIDKIKTLGELQPLKSSATDGPAKRFKIKGSLGEIGFITAFSHHFCPRCNRLRLTADGQLRPCLFSNQEWDLKTPLRQGVSDETLKNIIKDAIAHKPKNHGFLKYASHRPMSRIGG